MSRQNNVGDWQLALEDLLDTDLTGLADNFFLIYNSTSTNWEVVAAAGSDTSAIHKAIAGEIHALGDLTPALTDEVVIEDASNSWAKGRTQLTDIAELTPRNATIVRSDTATDVATGDGTEGLLIPASMNGFKLSAALSGVDTLGVGSVMNIQVRKKSGAVATDMLSTLITHDPADYFENDGAIKSDGSELVITGDRVYVDYDQVHTTPAKGAGVTLTFERV